MPSTVRAGCAAAWLGHPVPFHRCAQARSRPALVTPSPADVHALAAAHEIAPGKLLAVAPSARGAAWADHALPFQPSVSACAPDTLGISSQPTAWQPVAAERAQDTPVSVLVVALARAGTGSIVNRPPRQDSASAALWPVPAMEVPVATHEVADAQEAAISEPPTAPAGSGTICAVHRDPFQLSASETVSPELT